MTPAGVEKRRAAVLVLRSLLSVGIILRVREVTMPGQVRGPLDQLSRAGRDGEQEQQHEDLPAHGLNKCHRARLLSSRMLATTSEQASLRKRRPGHFTWPRNLAHTLAA